jgi:streptogramin lyase
MFRVNNTSGYPLMDIDGDGTVLFTTQGNVGIGTTVTSPTYKLDVGGDVNIRGALTVGNSQFGPNISIAGSMTAATFHGSGIGITNFQLNQVVAPGFTGQLMVNNAGLITATPALYYDIANARIGIGSTLPSARLSIASTTGDSVFQVGDNVTSGSMFRVNNTSGYPLMDIDGDGTVLFTTQGNVGIGTTVTSPDYKLEVGGNVNIRGALNIGSNTFGSSNVSISGSMTAGSFYGSGIGITNFQLNQVTAPGFTGQLLVNNAGLITATPALYYDITNARIGIGSTLPSARLSIASTTGDSIFQVGDNVTSGSMFRVTNTVGYPLIDIDGDGTVLFTTTGNVGIGTTITSPAYKLEVGGDARVGVNTSQGLVLTSPNGTRYRIFVNDAGALSTIAI